MFWGGKDSTWRLFDDKDLQKGDRVALINWNTKEKFGEAVILSTREKELRDLTEADFDGHEKFESTGKMYEEYRKYYGEKVTPESVVKIIKFELQG